MQTQRKNNFLLKMWLWTKNTSITYYWTILKFFTQWVCLKNVKYRKKLRTDGMYVLYNKRDEKNMNNERELMWKTYFGKKWHVLPRRSKGIYWTLNLVNLWLIWGTQHHLLKTRIFSTIICHKLNAHVVEMYFWTDFCTVLPISWSREAFVAHTGY